MWKKYSPEGLVVLALSDEPASKVEKAVAEWPMPYPVGAGSPSSGKYRVRGIPQAFLIGGDGTILWEGHPMSKDWEAVLPEALAAARSMSGTWDPGERDPVLKRAVAEARKGRMDRAWKETERLLKKYQEEPARREAIEGFRKDFLAMARDRASWYLEQAERGRYATATEGLERLCRQFAGSPPEAEWKERLKAWKDDDQVQALVRIEEQLRKARALLAADRPDQAAAALRRLLQKAEGTLLEGDVRELLSQATAAAGG